LDKTISKYDDEITFTDQQIGKLLKTLKEVGLRSQTLVVITADHGEGLMQHNHMEHGVNIYDELVRVPLLFSWHNHIPMNRVLNTPVGLIDLAPTILDLLDIKADSWSVQGQSLAEALRGQVPLDPMRPVFLFCRHYNEGTVGHTWVKGKKFGIRVGKWKYIEGFQENTKELFDLENDPNELINLYDNFPKKSLELASKLQEWKQENTRANSNRGQISKEDSSRLRSLGYVE
jgi:arylsulfatase A-like enzyme